MNKHFRKHFFGGREYWRAWVCWYLLCVPRSLSVSNSMDMWCSRVAVRRAGFGHDAKKPGYWPNTWWNRPSNWFRNVRSEPHRVRRLLKRWGCMLARAAAAGDHFPSNADMGSADSADEGGCETQDQNPEHAQVDGFVSAAAQAEGSLRAQLRTAIMCFLTRMLVQQASSFRMTNAPRAGLRCVATYSSRVRPAVASLHAFVS